jgi:DNA-binding NarL/FixJ family response regulator
MLHLVVEALLIDDQLVVRRGVELLLREAGVRIAGLAATPAEAEALLRRRRHDVALVDTLLGGTPTAPLLAALLAERPEAPVLVLAGRDGPALRAATAIGAPGVVLKSSPPDRLLAAVEAVAAGGSFTDPELAARLPAVTAPPVRRGVELLSPRERQILSLLADGLSGAEIAARLYLSSETVRTHVRNAVQKLGARTRTEAVARLLGHPADRDALIRAD